MSVTIDPQIMGVVDDGTDEGAVRASLVRGDLVMVPFAESGFSVSDVGGASAASWQGASYPANPDGSGTGILVVVPQWTSGTPTCIKVSWVVYGTVVGLRWLRSTGPAFGCVIDGVAYEVPNALTYPETGDALTGTDADPHNLQIIARDLPDGPHVVSLVFVGSSVQQYTYTLFGYVAEGRAGYRAPDRVNALLLNGSGVLGTSQNRILPAGIIATRGIRKVLYHNTDSEERTITIQFSDAPIKVIKLAAGASGEFDLGGVTAVQRAFSSTGSLRHAADVAAKVNYAVIVGL